MIYIRRGRILWDFRIGACRLYHGPRIQVDTSRPLPDKIKEWPFLRVEVE